MAHRAWLTLVLLAGTSSAAFAADDGGLNDTQRLGRRLYVQSCMVCHTKPQMTAGLYGPALSREAGGGQPEVMRQVIADGTPRMPAFKVQFEPQQIAAIVEYLKTVPPATSSAAGSSKGDVD